MADTVATDVGEVTFWLEGVGHHRNPDRVVHLYDYLLAGARWARRHAVAPELSTAAATVDGGLVGPLRLHANDAAALFVSGASLVDADGAELRICEPGGEFYLARIRVYSVTVTARVPATAAFGGRVSPVSATREQPLTPSLACHPLVVDFTCSGVRRPALFDEQRLHAVGGDRPRSVRWQAGRRVLSTSSSARIRARRR
jgi:hypothetical protein